MPHVRSRHRSDRISVTRRADRGGIDWPCRRLSPLRLRPAHHEISIRPLTRALAETRTYAGGKHPRLPCCGPARGRVQRAGSLPHPRSPRNRLSESASAAPLYGDPVGQLLKLLCKVGQLVAETPERFVNRHHSEMRGPFSVVCLSRTRRVAEEFKSPQSLVGHIQPCG